MSVSALLKWDVDAHIPNVMAFGGGAFGVLLDPEDGTLTSGISALWRET